MNDEALAALERRLTPVLAEGGRGVVNRHDVLDLMAECRSLRAEMERLRRPPDASGLLTAEQVRGWRELAARLAPPAASVPSAAWRFSAEVRDLVSVRAGLPALLAHIDALEALVHELYGVVSDLHADDPGRQALLERGRAEGREQAARAAEERDSHQSYEIAETIRALGPCRPPLPPQEAEREAGRLREALRGLLGPAQAAAAVLDDASSPGWASDLLSAARAARRALGEDS